MKYKIPLALLSHFITFLDQKLGLIYPVEHYDDLLNTIYYGLEFENFNQLERYVQQILQFPDRADLDKLSEVLTIGETYFFRDGCGFDHLQNHIIPAIIQTKKQTKSIRIWSAGCCTGEEPYSIAMVIDQLIPQESRWNVSIFGTDINKKFLETAQAGIYREWSFRNTPKELKKLYFNSLKDSSFELIPRVKKMVHFAPINLIEDQYPLLENGTNGLDLILCNNTMIYFSEDNIKRIVQRFRKCLLNHGLLVVTPVEVPFVQDPYLQKDKRTGGFKKLKDPIDVATQFHLPSDSPKPVPFLTQTKMEVKTKPVFVTDSNVLDLYEDGKYEQCVEQLKNKELDIPTTAILVRSYTNLGMLEEACQECRKQIEKDDLIPVFHFLLGNILYEQNLVNEAQLEFKRALFLDRNFIMAHFSLVYLLLEKNQKKEALIHKRAIIEELKKVDFNAILYGSDSMKASKLDKIIKEMVIE